MPVIVKQPAPDLPYSLHDARCTFQENALECGVTAMVATAMKISRGN